MFTNLQLLAHILAEELHAHGRSGSRDAAAPGDARRDGDGFGILLAFFFPKVNSSEIDILWVSKHQQWEIIGYS